MIEPTITQALRCWSTWTADHSPIRETGERELDLMLADAFRVLLIKDGPEAKLAFLEQEVMHKPRRRQIDHLYTAELTRWWLDIYEEQVRPALNLPYRQTGEMTCASSRSIRSTQQSTSVFIP